MRGGRGGGGGGGRGGKGRGKWKEKEKVKTCHNYRVKNKCWRERRVYVIGSEKTTIWCKFF